jgi:glycosyltransferase involved in cell wall biosynthesis
VPDLTIRIVGEGYERERLDAVIRELDAERWVQLTGRVDEPELVRLYQQAWVAASASAREGWGLSLTEAAACGTPAVATRIAGHTDAVRHGVSGLLVPGTADDLSAALVQVLRDPARRARLAAGAQQRASTLSWEATALGVMRSLAGQATGHRP